MWVGLPEAISRQQIAQQSQPLSTRTVLRLLCLCTSLPARLDVTNQTMISVYAGGGILIESQGPTWLYGTASEHNVLYQYQLNGASNLLLGMIQTESPYYQ